MEQNDFMLSATAISAALAVLFAIIGVAAPGWPPFKNRLLDCNRCGYNTTAAGVLLIIAILLLVLAGLVVILYLIRKLKLSTGVIKAIILFSLIIAGIFIVAAYSRVTHNQNYSYHLAATAGILAFSSAIFFAYWLGRTSFGDRN